MKHLFLKFRRCERAATAIEYSLIASLIALAIIVGAMALGTSLNADYSSISGNFGPAS